VEATTTLVGVNKDVVAIKITTWEVLKCLAKATSTTEQILKPWVATAKEVKQAHRQMGTIINLFLTTPVATTRLNFANSFSKAIVPTRTDAPTLMASKNSKKRCTQCLSRISTRVTRKDIKVTISRAATLIREIITLPM
jgi:hypothetical protein